MATVIQRRRGTTAEHATFTGALGELTVDTTKDTVVVHDGATAGGFPLMRQDFANATGQLGGLRNKVINGKMTIAQRGTSFAAAAGYTLDRWQLNYNTTAVRTITQQSDVPSANEFQYSLRYAVTTADTSIAAGDLDVINQDIEGFNARDLIGRTFAFSFWARSSKTGVHCVAFRNNVDRSYVAEYTIVAANTWEYKTVTVSGGLPATGTWNWTNGTGLRVAFVLACGTTRQTTANAWQTGDFYATANQVNCLDTIGNIFAITGVQIEVGSVATPFEHRPYGLELALCQRYYYKTDLIKAAFMGRGALGTTGAARLVWMFPVALRAAPTFGAIGTFDATTGYAGAPVADSLQTTHSTIASTNTVASGSGLYLDGGATGAMTFSAEL